MGLREPTRTLIFALLLWCHAALGQDYGTHWLAGVQVEAKDDNTSPVVAPQRHDAWYWLASWQALLVCEVADILSTEWARQHNPQWYEQNPIPREALYPIKIAIPFGAGHFGWNDAAVAPRVAVNLIACSAVVGNIQVGRGR